MFEIFKRWLQWMRLPLMFITFTLMLANIYKLEQQVTELEEYVEIQREIIRTCNNAKKKL
jgi:hypothetical protein